MQKNNQVSSKLKQMACVGYIFSVVAAQAQAQAQTIGQPAETIRTQTAPAILASNDTGERGLPSIAIAATKSRQQAQQLSQRTDHVLKQNVDENRLLKDSFGSYVETVTGAHLELFGKNLFTDVPTTFAPFDSMQVNADYVIGPGDELQVRGWGMVNIDVTATVDRGGAIYIPRVGSIKVAGIKYHELQAYLKQAIGKIFSNFELTASIAQTRAVQIYVVGHAVRPGTYTLNSMSTLLNALFTSGGPDATGSMRNIELKRGTETVSIFDLYDLLVKGDKSRDATLRDGDIIYIPEVGPLVALTGNVKTPAIFELKGASSLLELLNWAGGVDSSSEQKQVIFEKTVNNTYQTLAELVADKSTISSQLAGIPVQPTDVIRVFAPSAVAVQAQLQNEYVRVFGEVKQSGVFQIGKGETLRELMSRLGGATESGYLYALQFKRESVRRAQQIKLDEIAERFEREVESSATARLSGTTDKDAISVQAAELERQRRVAQKLRMVKAEGRIVLELENGSAQLKNLPELALQDGDSIFVPRKPGTIDVLGSVFQSNSFIFKQNRSTKDYILLAGGPTLSAAPSEMYVIRADGTAKSSRSIGWFGDVANESLNPGDTIVMPESIDRSNFRQTLKEWTAIFYQFGLGAAGLKVLKN